MPVLPLLWYGDSQVQRDKNILSKENESKAWLTCHFIIRFPSFLGYLSLLKSIFQTCFKYLQLFDCLSLKQIAKLPQQPVRKKGNVTRNQWAPRLYQEKRITELLVRLVDSHLLAPVSQVHLAQSFTILSLRFPFGGLGRRDGPHFRLGSGRRRYLLNFY